MKKGHFSQVSPQIFDEGSIKGVEKRVLIGLKEGAPNFVMRLFTMEPGGHTDYHSHPWEHEVFVVEGEITVVGPDGKEETLKEGSFVFVEPNEKHQFKNNSNKTARFICVIPKSGGE